MDTTPFDDVAETFASRCNCNPKDAAEYLTRLADLMNRGVPCRHLAEHTETHPAAITWPRPGRTPPPINDTQAMLNQMSSLKSALMMVSDALVVFVHGAGGSMTFQADDVDPELAVAFEVDQDTGQVTANIIPKSTLDAYAASQGETRQ